MSCASAGNCSAGGFYTSANGGQKAFVVSETNGTWGAAEEVPGTGAVNQGNGQTTSVSCASAGNCSAGGFYPTPKRQAAFAVGETNGVWGTAVQVPGTDRGGFAEITSVSCTTAGNCSAGGLYENRLQFQQAFVVSERTGTWGTAIEVPGTARLNGGDEAEINSVSCASAGNCSAVGQYLDSNDFFHAFVVSEVNGTWGKAIEAPGTASLNQGGRLGAFAGITSVSCASAGHCGAGGFYTCLLYTSPSPRDS